MEYAYKRDLNHSYLILSEDCPEENEFQKKMLLNNKIYGLLPCFLRYKDGRQKYYYDISSMQPMEQVFEVKRISYEELKNFFNQLQLVVKELGNYLLDSSRLVLDMKYIYWDLSSGDIYLVYYPAGKGSLKEGVTRLAEEIIEKTDHKDERAVDAAYRFYQLAGEDNFSFKRWAEILELEMQKGESRAEAEIRCDSGQAEPLTESREAAEPEIPFPYEGIPESRTLEPGGKEKKPLLLRAAAGLAAVTAAVAGIKYITDTYVFSAAEIEGGIILLTAGVVLGFYLLWKKKRKRDRTGIAEGAEEQELYADTPPEQQEEKNDTDGETVFLGMSGWEQERRLEGRIRGKELCIQMEAFPFVLGKLKERVSYVLADPSVSRLHAEFSEENGRLYLKDLNSRNGTCKNGIRLEGDEKVEVRPGDEIRIGRLLFIYH